MAGGLLIQSTFDDLEVKKVYDFTKLSKSNEITRCTPYFI